MTVCPFCAEEVKPDAIKCKHCGESIDQSNWARERLRERDISSRDTSDGPAQPGKVQAVAIMMLCGGIWSILLSLTLAATTCFLWLPAVYGIVCGIMAIIRAVPLLGSKAYVASPPKGVAIMLIINIINGDFINLVLGILCLIFLGDQGVQDYFARGRN
jgi:hypothetical protein